MVWEVTFCVTALATVETFDKVAYKVALAGYLNVPEASVQVSVSSASVLVVATITASTLF